MTLSAKRLNGAIFALYFTSRDSAVQQRRTWGKHTACTVCGKIFFKRWFAVPSLPLRQLPTNYDINKSSSMPTLTHRGRDFAFSTLRKSDNKKRGRRKGIKLYSKVWFGYSLKKEMADNSKEQLQLCCRESLCWHGGVCISKWGKCSWGFWGWVENTSHNLNKNTQTLCTVQGQNLLFCILGNRPFNYVEASATFHVGWQLVIE